MSNIQYKVIARRFVEEIFNAREIEAAKNFVTPDIIYHGIAEKVRGLEDFKKWVGEDLSAFSDMQITILDEKIEIEGTEILHFEKDKIKEGWTTCNMAELVK